MKIGRAAAGLLIFCALCAVFACSESGVLPFSEDNEPLPEMFKITPAEFSLKTGDSYTLSVSGEPLGTESIEWFSDSASATVDSAGSVTGISAGLAIITAKALNSDGTELAVAESRVTVGAETVIPMDFLIVPSSFSLSEDATKQLSTENVPTGATVSWSSDSSSVATVDSGGLVTAKAAGQATITAEARQNGSVLKTATCVITVFSLTAFRIDPPTLTLALGASATLEVKNIPPETDLVEWISSSPGYATVASAGSASAVVTALGAGQLSITATAKDASGTVLATATCAVTVPAFSIDQSNLTFSALGQTATLTASNNPHGTDRLFWHSGNPAILTVNASTGLLTVVGGTGVVTISVKALDASWTELGTASCEVTVTIPPPFKIDQNGLTLSTNGATATLTTSNAPSGTASVAWSSGVPSVLTVNASTGLLTVTGGPGNVTITAKAMPSSGSTPLAEATCTVAVTYGLGADVLAVLVKSGESTETLLRTPTYTLANVISAAYSAAPVGTETEPSKIMLIAGKTYTLANRIQVEKNLQISTYSSGTATITKSSPAGNNALIYHTWCALVLGDGIAANRLVLDGGGGAASNSYEPPVLDEGGKLTLKDGVEITGGRHSGIRSGSTIYMEGGVIRGNTSIEYGGGIQIYSVNGAFHKIGGTIYGNDGTPNANTAGDGRGHAVSRYTYNRNATAGPEVSLSTNSSVNWD